MLLSQMGSLQLGLTGQVDQLAWQHALINIAQHSIISEMAALLEELLAVFQLLRTL